MSYHYLSPDEAGFRALVEVLRFRCGLYPSGFGYQWRHVGKDRPIDQKPLETEQEALTAAREAAGFCEHGVSDEEVCGDCSGLDSPADLLVLGPLG